MNNLQFEYNGVQYFSIDQLVNAVSKEELWKNAKDVKVIGVDNFRYSDCAFQLDDGSVVVLVYMNDYGTSILDTRIFKDWKIVPTLRILWGELFNEPEKGRIVYPHITEEDSQMLNVLLLLQELTSYSDGGIADFVFELKKDVCVQIDGLKIEKRYGRYVASMIDDMSMCTIRSREELCQYLDSCPLSEKLKEARKRIDLG